MTKPLPAAGAAPAAAQDASRPAFSFNLGANTTDRVGFDVRYFDTDEHSLGNIYDARLVGAVKVTL